MRSKRLDVGHPSESLRHVVLFWLISHFAIHVWQEAVTQIV